MGDVKIRYYVTHQHPGCPRYGYWSPCLKRGGKPTRMALLGFTLVDCGEDGPAAWAIAERWNARWDAVRKGALPATPGVTQRIYPAGSIGEAYARFRATKTWLEKKPRTREDWERGWKLIDPVFGDVDPRTLSLEDVDAWYAALLDTVGVREAHRAMKIWRALWRVVATIKVSGELTYCNRNEDPSLGIRRKTPTPRDAFWVYDEARKLVKDAWRQRYYGLAAALAVAWDSMWSPVDVRTLTLAQLKGEAEGPFFSTDRAKTGFAAIGTLSHKTVRLLNAYLKMLPPNLLPSAPIFYTRGYQPSRKGGKPRLPVPYTADTFGDDFRDVRAVVFPGDHRQIMDFRRSGALEVKAGAGDDKALAGKMANTIDKNRMLQQTYLPASALPPDTTLVRLADAARTRGRSRLRGASGPESKR